MQEEAAAAAKYTHTQKKKPNRINLEHFVIFLGGKRDTKQSCMH